MSWSQHERRTPSSMSEVVADGGESRTYGGRLISDLDRLTRYVRRRRGRGNWWPTVRQCAVALRKTQAWVFDKAESGPLMLMVLNDEWYVVICDWEPVYPLD